MHRRYVGRTSRSRWVKNHRLVDDRRPATLMLGGGYVFKMGGNILRDCHGRRGLWIWGDCRRCHRHRQGSFLYLPGDFFHLSHWRACGHAKADDLRRLKLTSSLEMLSRLGADCFDGDIVRHPHRSFYRRRIDAPPSMPLIPDTGPFTSRAMLKASYSLSMFQSLKVAAFESIPIKRRRYTPDGRVAANPISS